MVKTQPRDSVAHGIEGSKITLPLDPLYKLHYDELPPVQRGDKLICAFYRRREGRLLFRSHKLSYSGLNVDDS